MGAIDTLPVASELEAIYIGYFGRAADGGGLSYWEQQYAKDIAAGLTVDQTLTAIANSFAVQAETVGLYPFLAGSITTLTTANLVTLVTQIYQNLFGHNPDGTATTGGLGYWVGQLHSGAVSLGSAILAISNGAQGVDATVLLDRIQVANTFSSETATVGIGTTVNTTFLTEARDVILSIGANGNNGAAALAEQIVEANAAIAAFVANGGTVVTGPGVTFTLTLNQDTVAGFGNDIINAPLVIGTILGTTVQFPTLTSGDSVTELSPGSTLNATFNTITSIFPLLTDLVTNLTLTGISAFNLSNISPVGGIVILVGNITSPTTLTYSNSLGDMQIGSALPGQAVGLAPLVPLLNTINVSNDAFLFGYQYLAISMKATDFTGTDSITVNASGVGNGMLVNNAHHQPTNFGVIAGPTTGTVGYQNWTVNSTGGAGVNNNLALGAESATNAKTLVITDDGANTFIRTSWTDGSGAGNWANLTSINASTTTGAVTISGGEFGGAGLLDLNTKALVTVAGGTGADVFDLTSSAWTVA